jgi:hypothetical protein
MNRWLNACAPNTKGALLTTAGGLSYSFVAARARREARLKRAGDSDAVKTEAIAAERPWT